MANSSMIPSRAIVCSEPETAQDNGKNWELQDILVPADLRDGELLVEIVASGICHSDLTAMGYPSMPGLATYPRIAGHEGAGYVKALGSKIVKDVKVGDPVLLSFDHCGKCPYCESDRPAYCTTFMPLNVFGQPDVFKTRDSKQGIGGKFFGQCSFANLTVVNEASVLPALDLVKSREELKIFAPLGCGIQTGAGSVLNLAKAGKDDRVMITGLGGVGLSAMAAAVISGCQQIIAVDRIGSRIEKARRDFGATHGLNTAGVADLTAAMKEITGGLGPTIVIETTGAPVVVEAAYASLANQGQHIQIGVGSDRTWEMKIKVMDVLSKGVAFRTCVEGDAVPKDFIPKLIDYYREGKLPLDKMNKYYKVEDFKTALHDMHTGETIKPVLLF